MPGFGKAWTRLGQGFGKALTKALTKGSDDPPAVSSEHKEKPGSETRASPHHTMGRKSERRLVDLVEGLVHAGLDRLSGLGGDLLGKRAEFLALRGQRFELLARMRAGQFHDFRQRLRRHDLAG